MRLYQIADQLRLIADRTGETGELSPEDAAALDALEGGLEAKVANIVAAYRELDVEAEATKAEADRLAQIAKHRRNGAERLRAYLCRCLDAAGVKEVPTPLGRVTVQDSPRPAIAWPGDPLLIPTGFRRETVSLDGAAAWAALRDGKLPEGFAVSRSRFVRVY